MKNLLFIVTLLILLSPIQVKASNEENDVNIQSTNTKEKMTIEQAQKKINETLNDNLTKAAKPLNNKVDYISHSYDEGDLRALIKNYEKTNRKIAKRQNKTYIPYDQKIDVNDPQKVKRYLRKRVDIVF